jgi:UDP-N-acetylmuramyl pentapeptide phosphotransferase/UDP-N-acetylglucosamine-1-phosphate transferase
MVLLFALLLLLACACVVWIGVRMLLPRLVAWHMLDHPNVRSSHINPTPRGGGLSIVAALTLPVGVAGYFLGGLLSASALLAGFLGLALVSWRDDHKSLPIALRLGAQVAGVGLALTAFPTPGLIFQGVLPAWLDPWIAGLLWVWFINLYNFMDGVDGITASETALISLGVLLVASIAELPAELQWLAAAVAGAACGFLFWNWSPAKVFLGDVGSIPLGYIVGFLLLMVAAEGYPFAALLLPLYYLFDATWTLLARIRRGARFWEAHREHAYQVAAGATSHAAVVQRISALGIALIVLAALSVSSTETTVSLAIAAAAFGMTVALFWHFRRSGRRPLKTRK